MMEIFEAIYQRYSYRGEFKNIAVPRLDLEKIVQAGMAAPSGKNAQTTEFVIVDDPGLLQTIGSMHVMKAMQQAKAMIVCLIDKKPEAVYEGYAFQAEDCAAAVQNMLLAITALGYAAVWIDGWLRLENRNEKVRELLGAPKTKVVKVLLPIGVPAARGERKEKKPFSERAWFNKYHAK